MAQIDDDPLERRLGLLPGTPETIVLREILSVAVSIVSADEGSLLLLDDDGANLRFAMTVPSGESERKLKGQLVPIGSGVTGLAAATRQVHVGAPVYRDIAQTERMADGPDSVIAAPMVLGDAVIGVMTAVTFTKGRLFTARETDLYARFSGLAGLLVEQTNRLKARHGDDGPPPGLGDAAALEHDISNRLRAIAARRPSALAPLAQIIQGIERLVDG